MVFGTLRRSDRLGFKWIIGEVQGLLVPAPHRVVGICYVQVRHQI